jgi:hypothetical protein
MLNILVGLNNGIKNSVLLFFVITMLGCKSSDVKTNNKLELKFLDEFILSKNIVIDSTLVGGLSGIDYYNGLYYLVCDDPSNPRFYVANIEINNTEISNVVIESIIKIQDTSSNHLDLESIRYDVKSGMVLLTSEGHINKQKDPQFFSSNAMGQIDSYFNIPSSFYSNNVKGPRHNGALEGFSKSVDGNGYWIAMELPLKSDGPEPQLEKTNSPVRITYIDAKTNESIKQFGYHLDAVAKMPKGNFMINGLTEILEYDKDKFLLVERSFSSGLGNYGNTVKIFNVDATNATNTLEINSLKDKDYIPASKELLLDFENYRDKLTNNSIDNIEGITFGPRLANGNKTLILVADNNFNKLGAQLNQFILLEIVN